MEAKGKFNVSLFLQHFFCLFPKYYGHRTILLIYFYFLASLFFFIINTIPHNTNQPIHSFPVSSINPFISSRKTLKKPFSLLFLLLVLLLSLILCCLVPTMPCSADFDPTCGGSEFGNTIISQYAHMMRLSQNSAITRTMTSLNSAGKREANPTSEDNQPARFELFLLGDGEKKVTEEADPREYIAAEPFLHFLPFSIS